MKCHCFVDNKCKQENSKKERLMLYEVIVISRYTIAQMKPLYTLGSMGPQNNRIQLRNLSEFKTR